MYTLKYLAHQFISNDMKKLKLPTEPQHSEIDWDTPQWVISDMGNVVLTTGEHYGVNFTGTCLPCESYINGDCSENWDKRQFRRLDFDIPFTISNKED